MSVGQQSVILSDMRSDIYLEKVDRWMDQIDQCSQCDTVSLDAAEMLSQILHDKNVDNQPYLSMSQCGTNIPSLTTQELPSPVSKLDASDVFLPPNSDLASRKKPTNTKQKIRLQSVDSGVDSEYQEDTRKEQDLAEVICYPLPEAAENTSVDEMNPEQIVKSIYDVRKIEFNKQQTSNSPGNTISDVLLLESSTCSYDQDSSCSEKSIAGMSHYFDPEAIGVEKKFPYIQHSRSCIMEQFDDPSNQAFGVVDDSKGSKVESLKSASGAEHSSSENDELKTVTVGDYTSMEATGHNFESIFRHKSTQETGKYIGFEYGNETIGNKDVKVESSDSVQQTDGYVMHGMCNDARCNSENDTTGNYVESSYFKSNKDMFKGDTDQILSSSEVHGNSTYLSSDDVVGLRSTEAVGDYVRQENAIIGDGERSGDLRRHESSELCQYEKHCNSVGTGHTRSPDPAIITYTFNSDGYIIDNDYAYDD